MTHNCGLFSVMIQPMFDRPTESSHHTSYSLYHAIQNETHQTVTMRLISFLPLLLCLSAGSAFTSPSAVAIRFRPAPKTMEEDFELTRRVVKFQEDLDLTRQVIASFIREQMIRENENGQLGESVKVQMN